MRESCAPKRSTEAPWAVAPSSAVSSNMMTTHLAAYANYAIHDRAVPIKKNAQHDWSSTAKFDTRSTAQEAFQGMQAGGMRVSCKPIREFEPTPWPSAPVTTNSVMFTEHMGGAKRTPFRPKPKELDASRFDTRSTAQDSYHAPASHVRPRPPIYPAEKPYDYTPFDHTSTSRSAYVAHLVTPFVAAQKPKASMGPDGMLA